MKTRYSKFLLISLLVMVLGVPAVMAKETRYCFVISHSLRDKTVYMTPIFTISDSGKVYTDEEYVTLVPLLRNMERQFQEYLGQNGVSSMNYATEARESYRSQAIAQKYWDREKKSYLGRGFTFKEAGDFIYTD